MYMTRNEVGARTAQVGKFRAFSIQSRLSPSDQHLFFDLEKSFAVQSQRSDQETKDVQDWLQGLAATFFFEGMQKLKMSLLRRLSRFVYWARRSFRNAVPFVFFIWLFKQCHRYDVIKYCQFHHPSIDRSDLVPYHGSLRYLVFQFFCRHLCFARMAVIRDSRVSQQC